MNFKYPTDMKTSLLFTLFFSATFFFANAQETNSPLLFDEFLQATVLFRNGTTAQGKLDYSLPAAGFVFLSEDRVLALANPAEVVSIIFPNRRFIQVGGGVFYEEIPVADGLSLYVHWKSRTVGPNRGAYGGTTELSATESINELYAPGAATVKIDENPDVTFRPENTYYLKAGNRYKPFTSPSTLGRLYKDHKTEIEQFARENSIDFSNIEDIRKILTFCNQF